MTRPGKISTAKAGIEPRFAAHEVDISSLEHASAGLTHLLRSSHYEFDDCLSPS